MRKSIVKISLAVAALFYFSLTASAADTSCTHKWSDWKISREATCTSEGWTTRICAVCNSAFYVMRIGKKTFPLPASMDGESGIRLKRRLSQKKERRNVPAAAVRKNKLDPLQN